MGGDAEDGERLASLRAFMTDELGADPSDLVDLDVRLVEEEVIDSLGIFAVVDFIEERFSVVIEPEEVTIENFGTLKAIDALIGGKLAGTA